MRRTILLAVCSVAMAQPPGGNTPADPRWRTVGAGAIAQRPGTCTTNRSVYICNGAGCGTGGFEVDYCTATNTWSALAGGGGGGGGNVSNSGTPVISQISIWTDATHIKGQSNATLDTSGNAVLNTVNKVTITSPATGSTLTIPNAVVFTGPPASGTAATLGLNETLTGNKTFTGRLDASGATSTSPAKVGTTLPVTCITGDLFFKSNATAGQQIYECSSTNTWTQQPGSVSVPASATFLASDSGSNITALTAAQATASLNLFTTTLPGTVPASGGGTVNFLRADDTWAPPPGSPLTTKGDIFGFSTVGARIPVGANGTVFTADSAQALGVKWATPVSAPGTPYVQSFTAQTTVALTHNLGLSPVTAYVLECWDGSNQKIQPGTEVATNSNTVTVTFAVAQTGSCTVSTGGNGSGSVAPAIAGTTHQVAATGAACAPAGGTCTISFDPNEQDLGATSGNSTLKSVFLSGSNTLTSVEPAQTALPATGNLQTTISYDFYSSGLFNPADYGNIAGQFFRTQIINGRNSSDNTDKKTLWGFYPIFTFNASGQRNGLGSNVSCWGYGDCIGTNTSVGANSQSTAFGDEGIVVNRNDLFQDGSLTQFTSTGLTKTSCAVSAIVGSVAKSTNPTDFKTVNVTGSTAACNPGDWLTVDQGVVYSTDTNVENVAVTAVGASTITALFQAPHTNPPVAAAPVVLIGGGDALKAFGQNRFITDKTAASFNTGVIVSVVGQAVVGSGTGWSTGMVGGNANLPGCISFLADNVTASPFSGGNPLTMWYPIQAVVSATSITLAWEYHGVAPTGSAAYIIRPCGQTGNLTVSYGSNSETITGAALFANAFAWTSGHSYEQVYSSNSYVNALVQGIVQQWYGNMRPMASIFKAGDISSGVFNIQTMFDVQPSAIDDSTHARYITGIDFRANTQGVFLSLSGRSLPGSGIGLHTFDNCGGGCNWDDKQIQWTGPGHDDGWVYSGRSGVGMEIVSAANKLRLGAFDPSSALSFGTTLDYGAGAAAFHDNTVTIPDASGTMGLISGSITTGHPACFTVAGGATTLQDTGCAGSGSVTTTGSPALHQLSVFSGASSITGISGGTLGRLLIDQGASADPSFNAMSGDGTITNTGAFTIANLAVTNAKIANSTIDLTSKVTGNLPWSHAPHEVPFTVDGLGSVLTAGNYLRGQITGSCTITGWTLMADQSGTISIDLDAHSSSAPPAAPSIPNTTTDKISASAPMALSSAQSASGGSSEVSTWTTSRTIWDSFGINITGTPTGVTRITGSVRCE